MKIQLLHTAAVLLPIMAAKIAKTFSPFNHLQAILEALRKDSGILFEVTQDFLIKATRLHITSFFEMRMTKSGPWKKTVCKRMSMLQNITYPIQRIVKEPSAVVVLPNEVRIGQNSDHREIARFSSLQDRNFRPLLRQFEQIRVKRQETRGETG